mmetsp:Transcript_28744/g.52375  ORF Transcript_28744/g.52375 Transcript_28744/m.52375 type:complete len:223 (+) Transcript_28744:703-1371(+)
MDEGIGVDCDGKVIGSDGMPPDAGKKLLRKCSDLMAAFTGLPLKSWFRNQSSTSCVPLESRSNFTNQVLFTSSLTLAIRSPHAAPAKMDRMSDSVVSEGTSRMMIWFLLDLRIGLTKVRSSSTLSFVDLSAAAAISSSDAPTLFIISWPANTPIGMNIWGFMLDASNWSLTKFFLDNKYSKTSCTTAGSPTGTSSPPAAGAAAAASTPGGSPSMAARLKMQH